MVGFFNIFIFNVNYKFKIVQIFENIIYQLLKGKSNILRKFKMFLSKINSILFVSLLEQGYVTISFDYIKNMVCFNGFSGNFDKNNFFNGKKGLLYEMFF